MVSKESVASAIYGIFYDIFKKSGFPLSPDQLHKLRTESDNLAEFISQTIEKRVNEITSKVLKSKVEVVLDLERRVSNLEDRDRG